MARVETWGALLDRYRRHRQRPFWGTKAFWPDARGVLSRKNLASMREQGCNAAARVEKVLAVISGNRVFPASPSKFTQGHVKRLQHQLERLWGARECNQCLGNFLDALVFDRDEYTCEYCGRSADAVWKETGRQRTLFFERDHRRPRASRGKRFDLSNFVAACLTCNGLKRSLPVGPFLEELRSLANAVSACDRRPTMVRR